MANRFATIGLAVAVCASTALPAIAQETVVTAWDPLEDLNRATFAFNSAVATVIAPVIGAYREMVPEAVQTGVDNVFTNLREPLTTVSSALQGDLDNAGISARRFAVNLVAGIGGIHDAATPMGLVSRPEDVGSALCSYGVSAGPYLVLPLLGSSTSREALGLAVAYSVGYELSDDFAARYYLADGIVAKLSDARTRSAAGPTDFYAEQRDAYVALREEICQDALPPADLKASPFGTIIRKPSS